MAVSDIISSCSSISDSLWGWWDLALLSQQLTLNSMSACLVSLVGAVLEDMVHLLKCASGSLRDKEVCPDKREETKDGEEDVSSIASILDQRRSDETL